MIMRICFVFLSVLLAMATPGLAAESPGPFTVEYGQNHGGIFLLAGPVTILRAEATALGDDLVVAGTLQRPHPVRHSGYLHLVVRSPEGEPLLDKKEHVPGLSSRRKGLMNIPFRIKLGFIPPRGAFIRLRYQEAGLSEGDIPQDKGVNDNDFRE